MRPPRMVGVVERRLLVNYRTDPEVTARLLPAPLRPQVVNGWAVAGICLIRLGRLRPHHLPAAMGLRSENAAHRIAVQWDTAQGVASGVYIPRRDSDSLANVLVGGRLFPGEHNRARFEVRETERDLSVAFTSVDRSTAVSAEVTVLPEWLPSALFATLDQASDFFRRGAAGYSATSDSCTLDGLELRTDAWSVAPVQVHRATSSFFDDPAQFPPGAAVLDCALLMRDTPVTWNPLPAMAVRPATPTAAAPA